MEDLYIEGSETIPTITFKTDGNLKLEGRALPENAFKLFEPMLDWAKNIEVSEINIECNLDYFNTSVSKHLFDLFKEFESNKKVEKITIKWMYEDGDDEMLESGEMFEDMLTRSNFIYHKYAEVFN
ncbi:MAG: DUF1987 domain-containing protein [Bacteroidales bacterium]|nr:DUF1987 domain-containing protein [Bacteroidales bacterium]